MKRTKKSNFTSTAGGSKKYFAIRKGHKTGVFHATWNEVKGLVTGFSGAKYKGFLTESDAVKFLNENKFDSNVLYLECYTDGSYKGGSIDSNGQRVGGKSGSGVYVPSEKRSISARINLSLMPSVRETNNTGELYAIFIALTHYDDVPLLIHTDSEYCIGVLSGNQPKNNISLISTILCLIEDRKSRGIATHFNKVLAHSGIEGNEIADKLADAATNLSPGVIV